MGIKRSHWSNKSLKDLFKKNLKLQKIVKNNKTNVSVNSFLVNVIPEKKSKVRLRRFKNHIAQLKFR